MVLPGTVAFVVFRDEIGDDAASALPVMIERLMPPGLLGLMAASLLAALMSTIAAALNSAGTLVARDIVGHFRPQTSDAAQVRIGRIAAVVVMLLAMAWSTQGGRFGTIFEIINKIPALFLAPPITTVFLCGVFWKRGTRQAAVPYIHEAFLETGSELREQRSFAQPQQLQAFDCQQITVGQPRDVRIMIVGLKWLARPFGRREHNGNRSLERGFVSPGLTRPVKRLLRHPVSPERQRVGRNRYRSYNPAVFLNDLKMPVGQRLVQLRRQILPVVRQPARQIQHAPRLGILPPIFTSPLRASGVPFHNTRLPPRTLASTTV